MCGLAGVLNFYNRKMNKNCEIDSMLERIKHRGPDDSGICGIKEERLYPHSLAKDLQENVFGIMGFNRLSIQDTSLSGHQPMLSMDETVVITFNGEIYNVNELRKKLIENESGIYFRGTSDTEVILWLYQKYGFEKTVKMLNGMFAIVLYDIKENKLYMARDRFGIIPLHIWIHSEKVVWASEIKCFLELSDFKRETSNLSLTRSLIYCYPNDSIYKHVQVFQPGTIMEIYPLTGKINTYKYFDLNLVEQDRGMTYQEVLDDSRQLLERCVRRQLISDVSVGVQFSGGVDSTLIAKYVADVFSKEKRELKGFSLVNRNSEVHNEEPWIDYAASKIPITLEKQDMNPENFYKYFEQSMYAYERFINIPSPIGIYEFTRKAHGQVTVLLSGEGADEVCGGYGMFAVSQMLKNVHGFGNVKRFKGKLVNNTDDFLKNFDKQMEIEKCQKIYTDCDLFGVLEERKEDWEQLQGTAFDKIRKLYFKYELISLLERQNKICMANSIENRVPFLDNEFVEFMFRIPEEFLLHKQLYKILQKPGIKLSNGYEGKYLLKQLSAETYGNSFAFRNKQAIRVPLINYLRNVRFTEYIEDLIVPGLRKRSLINYEYFMKNYKNMNTEAEALVVWKAINMEVWHQLFVDGRQPI